MIGQRVAAGTRASSAPVHRLLATLALALVVVATAHPLSVAARTVLLMPAVFGDLPINPLAWVTPSPGRETFGFDYPAGRVEGDVYTPGLAGRHGALLLILGARPIERDAPVVVRFAEALSRAGAVVMVPASSGLAEGRVTPEEVDAIVEEIVLLRGRADVDPTRVGILGFSVGGSLSVLAAADPRLAGQLAFVNTFGGYNDARDLLRAVGTRGLAYAGLDEAWAPHNLTLWVLARQLVDGLPPGADRDVLERIFLLEDDTARDDTWQLSPRADAMLALLDGSAPAEMERSLALLPEPTEERLRAVSPSLVLDRVHAPLFVMHDVADRFVPYTESRRLVARAPPTVIASFREFELFDHVVPHDVSITPAFAAQVAELIYTMYRVMLHVL